MRRIFTVIAFLALTCAGAWADVEINSTNFPDENFRSIIEGDFDTDNDGVLTDSEISAVTTISVSYNGISSLKGIEFFTALTSLTCDGNQLTTLDVSSNTALTTLSCSSNNLATLDVSSNTALTSLSCNDQTRSYAVVTSTGDTSYPYQLDFSQLMSSDKFDNVSNVRYSVSSDTSSSIAATYSGGIAQFPAQPSSATYYYSTGYSSQVMIVTLSDLVVDPKLDSGDIEINAENFPDDTFRTYVSSNFDTDSDGVLTDSEISAVTDISVSSYGISSLKGIEFFTALTSLNCDSNQLTALDLSSNTALTSLSCNDNQLTALDVSSNTALTSLLCYGNQLTALDVSSNTALTSLNCINNQLTALDVSSNTALTSLSCNNNQLTALDLSSNTALTYLNCGSNQLTALDVSNNTALTELDCYYNQLTALDVSSNTALTELDCEYNQLTALDVSSNTALTSLNLSLIHI